MERKELTKVLLVGAAEDLNEVLALNPPIGVVFESALKGAPLKEAEKKFMDQLEKDLVEAASLIQPTDTLAPQTIDVLEALGVKDIRLKLASGGAAPPPDEAQLKGTNKGKKEKRGVVKPMEKAKGKSKPMAEISPKKISEKKKKDGKPSASKTIRDKSVSAGKGERKIEDGLNKFGHKIGGIKAKMDELLVKGVTYQDVILWGEKESGLKRNWEVLFWNHMKISRAEGRRIEKLPVKKYEAEEKSQFRYSYKYGA